MSGSADAIAASLVGEGVDREVRLDARLRAHPLDDPADPRRELPRVEAAGRPGHVAHQPGRELDLVQDAQHREHRPEVGGHGLLEREQLVHLLLDLEHDAPRCRGGWRRCGRRARGRRRGGPGSRRRSARSSWRRASRPRPGPLGAARRTIRRVSTTMSSARLGRRTGREPAGRLCPQSGDRGAAASAAGPVHLSVHPPVTRTLRPGQAASLRMRHDADGLARSAASRDAAGRTPIRSGRSTCPLPNRVTQCATLAIRPVGRPDGTASEPRRAMPSPRRRHRRRRGTRARRGRLRGPRRQRSATRGAVAVEGVTLDVHRRQHHRADRAVGLRQEHVPALVQPHERPHRRAPRCRAGSRTTVTTSTPRDVDPVEVRRRIGMVFQRPNPFPKSIYDNVAFGPRIMGRRKGLDEIVEQRAASRRALGRGQGQAQAVGVRAVRRSAAAAVHRALPRGRARRDPDGRAVLGARPDRDRRASRTSWPT